MTIALRDASTSVPVDESHAFQRLAELVPGVEVITAQELARDDSPPPTVLVRRIIEVHRGQLGALYGPPNSLKSMIVVDMAVEVAAAGGRVVIFSAETSKHAMKERLQGLAGGQGTSLEELGSRVVVVTSAIDLTRYREEIDASMASEKPDLVIVDPVVEYLGDADENDAREIIVWISSLRGWARQHGCAVIVVHHSSKAGNAGVPNMRGSSAFMGALDAAFSCERKSDEATCQLTNTKQRDAERQGKVDVSFDFTRPDDWHVTVARTASAGVQLRSKDLWVDVHRVLVGQVDGLSSSGIAARLKRARGGITSALEAFVDQGRLERVDENGMVQRARARGSLYRLPTAVDPSVGVGVHSPRVTS
ncbi:MAG: AAA family ATPase [Myxococcales bacterium]|nr:AAA family ATPase [Myxococcales bacterium]